MQYAITSNLTFKARSQLKTMQQIQRKTKHQLEAIAKLVDKLKNRIEILKTKKINLTKKNENLKTTLIEFKTNKIAIIFREKRIIDKLSINRRIYSILFFLFIFLLFVI